MCFRILFVSFSVMTAGLFLCWNRDCLVLLMVVLLRMVVSMNNEISYYLAAVICICYYANSVVENNGTFVFFYYSLKTYYLYPYFRVNWLSGNFLFVFTWALFVCPRHTSHCGAQQRVGKNSSAAQCLVDGVHFVRIYRKKDFS